MAHEGSNMARISRDARLETREARLRLGPRHQPYWRQVHPGLAIGYRKGTRGGVWIARRLIEGRYRFTRLGVADDHGEADGAGVLSYAQAQRRALEFVERPAAGGDPSAYTVGEATADYLDWFQAHRRSYDATAQTIRTHILPRFERRHVADLTAAELRRWHTGLVEPGARRRGRLHAVDLADPERKRARRATANRVLTVFKAALNFAYVEGNANNPETWRRVRPFRDVDAPRVRYLNKAECQRLLHACPSAFRDLVRGALLTGCRYGELACLRVADYVSDAGVVLVHGTKSGKYRHVPLTDEGREFFERLTAGRLGDAFMFLRADAMPWGRAHQVRPINEACTHAKISPPIRFHDLRHTYASLLVMAGAPLYVVSTVLGHADLRMTLRHYAHLSADHVSESVRAHLPRFGLDKTTVVKLR